MMHYQLYKGTNYSMNFLHTVYSRQYTFPQKSRITIDIYLWMLVISALNPYLCFPVSFKCFKKSIYCLSNKKRNNKFSKNAITKQHIFFRLEGIVKQGGTKKKESLESYVLRITWKKNLIVFSLKKGNFRINALPITWKQAQNTLQEWAASQSPWKRQSAVVSRISPLQEAAREHEVTQWAGTGLWLPLQHQHH